MILRDPATIFRKKNSGQQATQNARMTLVKPLDRVANAVDGAESSHGKDIAMWRPDPPGPKDRCRSARRRRRMSVVGIDLI
jgi:hypothetical protein